MKKLYKVEDGKMICGVCAGLAEYLRMDVNVVRIGAVVAAFCGVGVIAYIAAAILLPFEDEEAE
ncbi:MAG: PspC domain-containing protein [Oscillospiraceae bacterium]|nr:PspC domain-containing protein [Oscillospiraceae bacterium]